MNSLPIAVSIVKDLALRFADGRLSVEKLIHADDEELVRMLTEVRGIGKVCILYFYLYAKCAQCKIVSGQVKRNIA